MLAAPDVDRRWRHAQIGHDISDLAAGIEQI